MATARCGLAVFRCLGGLVAPAWDRRKNPLVGNPAKWAVVVSHPTYSSIALKSVLPFIHGESHKAPTIKTRKREGKPATKMHVGQIEADFIRSER